MTMKKRRRDELAAEIAGELVFLSGAFLLGAVFGSFFSSGFSMKHIAADDFLDGSIGLLSSFKIYFLIHGSLLGLITLGSFFPFGRIAVPFSIAAKGFLLAMPITCWVRIFGIRGYLPAATMFLLSEMICIFGFLMLGCRAAMQSKANLSIRNRLHPGHRQALQESLLSTVVAFGCILLAGWLQCCLMTHLTRIVLQWIQ